MYKLRSRLAFRIPFAAGLLLATLALAAHGDTIETTGGSILRGKILASDGGDLRIETDFGATVRVKLEDVKSITTDDTLFVALDDGTQLEGAIQASDDRVAVDGEAGSIRAGVSNIAAVWRTGDLSPAERARIALRRKWTSRVSLDINGRQGNSDRMLIALSGRTTLEGPEDRLSFYGHYARSEDNDITTQDEGRVGVDYANFISEQYSWYVRTELGFDRTKELNLRSQSAAGVGYAIIKSERQTLEGRAGLSYRFEDYDTDDDFDSVGLDFGLFHTYAFGWGSVMNRITYTPAFDDFGNFVIVHESTFDIPVGGGERWAIRFGLKNDYTSRPPAGLVKHDWTYLTGISIFWR